jgi:hypothetical protein
VNRTKRRQTAPKTNGVGKSVTEEQRAAFVGLYGKWVQTMHEMRAAQCAVDGMVNKLLAEHGVPPGFAIDLWGDGTVKAADKCKEPPKV